MKKLISVALLVIVAVAIFVTVKKNFSTKNSRPKGQFEVGAVVFETAPIEKLDMAAKFLQTEVTQAELVSRSPVLRDLLNMKLKILNEAIGKKFPEISRLKQSPKIEVYMEKPDTKTDSKVDSKAGLASKNQKLSFTFSNQRPNNGIVKVDEKLYDRQDLPLNQIHYSQIEMQIFEEKLRILGDLFTKQLLLKIAKDNNTTIQGYINKSILGLPLKDVPDVEVKLFAENKGIVLTEKDSALKERLRSILQEQKTEQSIEEHIKTKFPNEIGKIYFYPPSFVIPMTDADALASSSDTSKPTLMVFSSAKCNGCAPLADALNEIRSVYKDKVRYAFVHFFYGDDWKDNLTAQASICINSQSNDAFWDFFSKVSKSKTEITEAMVRETAKSTGINQDKFNKCFTAQTFNEEVHKQLKYAAQLGVTTAPTVIMGSQVLTGNNIEKLLKSAVEAGLSR